MGYAIGVLGRGLKAIPPLLITLLMFVLEKVLSYFGVLTPQTAAPRGWDLVMTIVRTIMANASHLLELRTDREGFREWLDALCNVLEPMADLTGWTQDDLVIELLQENVRYDPCYNRIYELLGPMLRKLPRTPLLSEKAQLDADSLARLVSALPLVYPPV